MKLPVIAIVGRPNVGKSTLFNCITQTRQAVVADIPGVTRDRQYGKGEYQGRSFVVIDSGGIGGEEAGIEGLTAQQTLMAIHEAALVLFLVDARTGLAPADKIIARQLRKLNKSVIVAINKTDGLDSNIASADFQSLGLSDILSISAAHRHNIDLLIKRCINKIFSDKEIPADLLESKSAEQRAIKLAIIGKPNAGKSTLVNRMLGEERVIVFDMPGTTRDSVYINLERQGKLYTLIDTAGVRRKSHITDRIEKVSVIKALQAIEEAHVIIFLIDAKSNISEQDLHLLGFIIDLGKSLVIAVNKWDGLSIEARTQVKSEIDRRLNFIDYAKIKFISALHGSGVGNLFEDVQQAHQSAVKKLTTAKLTALLQKAIQQHQPPMIKNRRIKLRYAHPGGENPPLIVIHGNQTSALPESYIRYLQAFFRKALKLTGTPVHIELKSSENPYKPSAENKPTFKPHPRAPVRRKKNRVNK